MDPAWLLIVVLRSFLITVPLPGEAESRDALREFQRSVPQSIARGACLAQPPLTRAPTVLYSHTNN
jgi:hypothetical protein